MVELASEQPCNTPFERCAKKNLSLNVACRAEKQKDLTWQQDTGLYFGKTQIFLPGKTLAARYKECLRTGL